MSTKSLACVLALGLTIPVTGIAQADNADPTGGGSAYSASANKKKAKKNGRANWHLGDRVPLRSGMRGHDVKILQDFINRIGIQLTMDGEYGRATWAAVRRIEKRGNRPINGIVDSGDISLIRRVATKGGFPPPPPPAELPAGSRAKVMANGLAAAPADAPQAVKEIIAAGNEIASKPYIYGGGHGKWKDNGYDCSGSVSYALHGAGLLNTQLDSTSFESWGQKGYGKYVTIYANGGHAWMMVAGLRFDTSGLSADGTRWHADRRSVSGYVIRHPNGL
jgi:cell wall-associated NlpC family hydrolase